MVSLLEKVKALAIVEVIVHSKLLKIRVDAVLNFSLLPEESII